MTEQKKHRYPWLFRGVLSEPFLVAVIATNAAALFLDAFPRIHAEYSELLGAIDFGCILFFTAEALLKIIFRGFADYWANHWNKFDFLIVILCIPIIVEFVFPFDSRPFAIVTLLRLGRFLRFMRLMRFVPNADHIWAGIGRALSASVSIFLVLLTLNLILAVGATMLFGDLGDPAPEFFGDPLRSLYTMFKVFTVEGWYEVPDALADANIDPSTVALVRAFFVFSVLVGGILGLSLANAVFVDEMTIDNNRELEKLVGELCDEVRECRQQIERLVAPNDRS
ncbi:MAG: ion transporter [Aureliella sp.]